MSKKLFVGGLAWSTTDALLKETFASFGNVVDAKVILERDTGRSRGFGFVSYGTEEEAQTALNAMNGKELGGRTIRVNFADELPPKSKSPKPFKLRSDAEPRREPAPTDKFRRESDPVDTRRTYSDSDFGYVPEDNNRRDSKRRDRKKNYNKFDDDDRW